MRLLSAVFFGGAAALFVTQASTLAINPPSLRAVSLSSKKRESLKGSTGTVLGTDSQLKRLLMRRMILVGLASVVGVLLVRYRSDFIYLIIALTLIAVAWQLPIWQIRAREVRRRKAVETELLDAIGEMVMGVEAGLTLEAAMSIYATRHQSPLADEFRAVLDRIGLGISRDQSLRELLERTPTIGMQLFVAAIRQNQRIGAPLAIVLRQQATTARRRRRQKIEEQSAKLAMKMVFPTVFCVLPALMIVVVGPAIIRTIQSLS